MKRSQRGLIFCMLALFVLCVLLASCSCENTVPTTETGATTTTVAPTVTTPATTPETTGGSMKNTLSIVKPTVNMAEVALGIDTTPYFGWTVTSDRENNAQSAYQIKVFSSKEKAEAGSADLWDSGKVE
ncbi:MAG: hypothetical protein J6S34_03935, partial [Clostridia bacterium]|nr:hypothetical protein [Clostridia bacterium]